MEAPPLPVPAGTIEAVPGSVPEGTTGTTSSRTTTGITSQEPGQPHERSIQSPLATLPYETTVANCFLSLRLLSATDWKGFFEKTSRVEQILRTDPARVYGGMDFDTATVIEP